MPLIPKFRLFGENDSRVEESIQSRLEFRSWVDLSENEKSIAVQQLINRKWLIASDEILETINYLNTAFLRTCPGTNLHSNPIILEYGQVSNGHVRKAAAAEDFKTILKWGKTEALVYRMLTRLAQAYIDNDYLEIAEGEANNEIKIENINKGYEYFDYLSDCLNHIFEQFSVNVRITRSGLMPRQDEVVSNDIYLPTLKMLSDPRWRPVSDEIGLMFIDYQEGSFSEFITKAHTSIQRFLQILVGEEGKSGRGEVAKLFAKAKRDQAISSNRFTEPIINVLQSFVVSERATNSTAKPAIKPASSSDALLVMNVVMVFLQHCLQDAKST